MHFSKGELSGLGKTNKHSLDEHFQEKVKLNSYIIK